MHGGDSICALFSRGLPGSPLCALQPPPGGDTMSGCTASMQGTRTIHNPPPSRSTVHKRPPRTLEQRRATGPGHPTCSQSKHPGAATGPVPAGAEEDTEQAHQGDAGQLALTQVPGRGPPPLSLVGRSGTGAGTQRLLGGQAWTGGAVRPPPCGRGPQSRCPRRPARAGT